MAIKTRKNSQDPLLIKIIESEIQMVRRNRWLTDNEKQLKVSHLNKLLRNESE